MDALRGRRRKTCIAAVFLAYKSTELEHLSAIVTEHYGLKQSIERKRMSWRAEKGRQQALDHIADEYFGNASVKQRTLRRREKDKKKRRKLRKRLTHRQGLLNNKIPVFVFGNGSWPRRKWGHPPVPRKALVRALARKGIVIILDECVTDL